MAKEKLEEVVHVVSWEQDGAVRQQGYDDKSNAVKLAAKLEARGFKPVVN